MFGLNCEPISHDVHTSHFADPRHSRSGFQRCIQCGRCSASCPAAYIYSDFSPRELMRCLQNGDLDRLISGEGIWRCGQCFSCHARCPRDNSPATAILALREKAVRKGVVSQDIADIESVLGRNLRETGQTLLPTSFIPPLGSLGERTRTRFTENPGARVRFGYREGSARAVDIPEDYRRTIRRILDRTGFG